MKNASKTMFKVGRIINIILIPLCAIAFILGFILVVIAIAGGIAASEAGGEGAEAAAGLMAYGFICIFYGIFLLAMEIITLIVCSKKNAQIENGSNETSPRIFLIVFGAVSDNVFYILSGIFSLIARSQESNQKVEVVNEPKQESTADAEIKENIEKYENNNQQ